MKRGMTRLQSTTSNTWEGVFFAWLLALCSSTPQDFLFDNLMGVSNEISYGFQLIGDLMNLCSTYHTAKSFCEDLTGEFSFLSVHSVLTSKATISADDNGCEALLHAVDAKYGGLGLILTAASRMTSAWILLQPG
jgi:hypothetical protein